MEYPENTLESFEAAANLGANWIETDVHTTRDGVVLAFHDCTLNRVAGVPGRINDKTWAEIQQIDLPGGYKIPSLEQILTRLPHLNFNIDVKDDASAAHLPDVIARTGAVDRVRIASFSCSRRNRTVRALRQLLPHQPVKTSAGEYGMYIFFVVAMIAPVLWPLVRKKMSLYIEPFESMQVPRFYRVLGRDIEVVTPRVLKTAHRYGLTVQVWTVDEPDEMRELIEMGVDGIITNRIDVLNEVLGSSR